jgi:ABC-type phosphate/phosphonate transport system ATPase subunit
LRRTTLFAGHRAGAGRARRLPAPDRRRKSGDGRFLRNDKAEIAADLEKIYGYFPRLKERASQLAGTLSGGEQQMLAIGRALMSRPKLLTAR